MKLFSMLGADAAAQPNNTGSIILLIAMGLLLVGFFFYSSFKRKKDTEAAQKAINELKIGDKIITTNYMFGTIKGITETTLGKVFLIESGEGKNVSYFNISANAIWGLDTKEDVILDAEGNPLQTPEDMKKAKEKLLKETEEKTEPVVEEKTEVVEEKKEEVKTEEKPKKTRKSTKKVDKE